MVKKKKKIVKKVLANAKSKYKQPHPSWHEKLMPYFCEGWYPYPSCQDGWKKIVLDAVAKIDKLNVPWSIGQIKEKFGTLRFYAELDMMSDEWRQKVSNPGHKLTKYDQKMFSFYQLSLEEQTHVYLQFNMVLRDAEHQSEVTCEDCGKSGSLRSMSWVRTLCDKCYKRHMYG